MLLLTSYWGLIYPGPVPTKNSLSSSMFLVEKNKKEINWVNP